MLYNDRVNAMDKEVKKSHILIKITDLLREKPLSISEISRKTKINRSTLRYYLSLLKGENYIEYERKVKLPGRPTYVKINKQQLETEHKEMLRQVEDYRKRMFKNPLTKEILLILSKKNSLPSEIFEKVKDKGKSDTPIAEALSILNFLKTHKMIQEFYSITKEGEKFLKK